VSAILAIPNTYADVLVSPDAAEWLQAMLREITVLIARGTFGPPCTLPPGKRALGLRWVFKLLPPSATSKHASTSPTLAH
jgi:hypothetical protein